MTYNYHFLLFLLERWQKMNSKTTGKPRSPPTPPLKTTKPLSRGPVTVHFCRETPARQFLRDHVLHMWFRSRGIRTALTLSCPHSDLTDVGCGLRGLVTRYKRGAGGSLRAPVKHSDAVRPPSNGAGGQISIGEPFKCVGAGRGVIAFDGRGRQAGLVFIFNFPNFYSHSSLRLTWTLPDG